MPAKLQALAARARARPLFAVLGIALLVAATVGLVRPFENKFPAYLLAVETLHNHGEHPEYAFFPTGYEAFMLAGMELAGRTGIVLLQALVYAGFVGLAYAALRLLRVGAVAAILGALAVGMHPQFLVGITRVTDLNLAAPLLVAVVTAALWIRRDGLSLGRAVLLGLATGALAAVRPNLLVVLPVVLFLVWPKLRLRPILVAAGAAFVPVLASSTIMLGHPVLLSSNGPYNFVAGANAHTETALLRHYNAELSLAAYLRRFEVTRLYGLQAPAKQDDLRSLGTSYIGDHPGEYAKLAGLKLVTAFRPDLRPREAGDRSPVETLVQVASALPVVVWLLAVALAARLGISTAPLTTRLVVALAVLYLLPLVLTNSDPRFRYALDAVLLLHAAAIAGRARPSHPSRAAARAAAGRRPYPAAPGT